MSILVTGAAGFIGYHTCKALLAMGEEVVGIDNLNDYYEPALKHARVKNLSQQQHFTFYPVNIADTKALHTALAPHTAVISHIIHLAAQAGVRYSLTHPEPYIESNITGQLNILETCRRLPKLVHLIYASSSSVYGGNSNLPFKVEDRVDNPISLYAATKRSGELMAHTYAHLYGIPSTGLRFFTVYGPWGRPDMAYFKFTRALFDGMPIQAYNHGNMKRDFTYIDDIIPGILAALDFPTYKIHSPRHQLFNLGNDKSESLLDMLAILEREIGKEAIIEYTTMQPGDVLETHADIAPARELLNYDPKTTITTGLPQFVAWYREFYKIG